MAEPHSRYCYCNDCATAALNRAVAAWYRDEAGLAYLRLGQAALTEYGLRTYVIAEA